MLTIIKDEDLFEHIGEYDVILIGTGIHCTMSQGIQRDVMLNYPHVYDKDLSTKYADRSKLGSLLECPKEGVPLFVLLYICNDTHRPDINPEYISYESLESCLKLTNILYRGRRVATTVLGCSRFDGNGDKDKVIGMMEGLCKDIDLYVYDYEQLSKAEKLKAIRLRELSVKEADKDAYYRMVKARKREANERKENNGHARY